MKRLQNAIQFSASDLVGHSRCKHLTALDLSVVLGKIGKPSRWDPLLGILQERGRRHEASYIEHLRAAGLTVAEIPGVDITPKALAATLDAMAAGAEVIVQAALGDDRSAGRADILRRVERPSRLDSWSYEIIDTKLARETKGGTVLQLCLYAELLERAQGTAPEYVYVVAPWSDFEPQQFRVADFAAYFRRAKAALISAIEAGVGDTTYPDPKDHCDICRWQDSCETRWRQDDHLCLVSGVSKNQISELRANEIHTVAALASMPVPLAWQPNRGAPLSYEKAREQARIQVESREAGELRYEMLPVLPDCGLCLLPQPSPGDVFFDIEGDPFVGEHGLEYLFGYQYRDADGSFVYVADWAFDRASEKTIFERFIDFVMIRRAAVPDLHIYHYAPYEPGALKRLMGRYATREDEVDTLLRGKVFVDLYSVVRNAIRAGVESYSIKRLEPLYAYTRNADLRDANVALASLQASLELGDAAAVTAEDRKVVQAYNADDCASTAALRDWLEACRSELIAAGNDVPRPEPGQDAPTEERNARQQKVRELVARLTADIPVDPEQRTPAQQATWILAQLLEWHRREEKATWWEHFRLAALTADELVDECCALGRLTFIGQVGQSPRGIPIHRYRFDQQDTDLRSDEDLNAAGGNKLGKAIALSAEERTIDIQKTNATAGEHPAGVYSHTIIRTTEQQDSLFRLGEYVAEHGIEGSGSYGAARALLLNMPPQLGGEPIRRPSETALEAALRVADLLQGGVFPIQGPPGTGKSHTGAHMICQLVKQGKKVGITANSHKVIRNLIDKILEVAKETGVQLTCIQKPGEMEPNQPSLNFFKDNKAFFDALMNGPCEVAAGTHFLWSRPEAHEVLDVLVVDEAAQMSLANVVAVAQAARTLILLGDPQQLDQPTQGTHPDGVGVSSLDHVLQGHHTISAEQGLFLEQTWRMHPSICAFDSELFYDGKLTSKEGCEQQSILSTGAISGSGLRYLPVPHAGNKSSSIEEAEAVKSLVDGILASKPSWVDRKGNTRELRLGDIVIITPYNAQVFEIQQRLPGARVGTVDKFQGQEAPIAIYSMATSSYVDAPHGMEFLYSANRFNVAISRAKCLAILVASPDIFEADCKTPRQMQLANAFCRYLELSMFYKETPM
ncbi:TM0106 family RecB-like putative nuclease [Phyllobacterium phragmitis]|uniref:TM0106 family RecB-like putative nuclease n=1 Tax=Phyllobacterium phragmitis TaxID=2670329 RepID=A0ABQ0H1X6_9HYPH